MAWSEIRSVFNGPPALFLLGTLLCFCGTVWSAVREKRSKDTAKTLNEQLLTCTGTIKTQSEQLLTVTKDTRNELVAFTKGGEADFYLMPTFTSKDVVRLMFFRNENSELPVYDLKVCIRDNVIAAQLAAQLHTQLEPSAKEPVRKNMDAYEARQFMDKATTSIDIANVAPRTCFWLDSPVFRSNHVDLSIKISSRNGSVTQRLAVRKVGEGFGPFASKATRDSDNVVVFESISPEYPRTADGGPDW